MRVKIQTFRYSATLGGFDDTPLVDFARDKEIVAFREHFYTVNEVPHLTCVVHYQDAIVPAEALQAAREIQPRMASGVTGTARSSAGQGASSGGFRRRDGAPDPCEGLSESERAQFNDLREWRASIAHQEGVPPFLVLTNRQLVAIVRGRPESPTALGHIDGIGPGKLERYGREILARLHGCAARSIVPAGRAAIVAPEIPARPEVPGMDSAAVPRVAAVLADEVTVHAEGAP